MPSAERALDWDGARNFRDLGGVATPLSRTGATIAGRIARGPRRELLTAEGWRAAEAWGLRSVVDLRTPAEMGARDGDPVVELPAAAAVVLAPTEDHAHEEFRAVCMPILDSPEYWAHNVRILPALVRGALEAIADSEPGVLVHCAAGRDRTGMVSALLLAIAGASSDDIVDDYAASVRAMAGAAAHGGPTHDRQAAWTAAEAEAWIGEVEHHVRAFVADVDGVLDVLGLRDPDRIRLRRLLTDPSL
ncbi:tyrosine-protein phosphatase [Agrococcus terreus]|uniref:tyrosine-protein phosphatase n=1 Tax=Agrococcus terreus TaxID=574649 RepID=UPI00384E67E3